MRGIIIDKNQETHTILFEDGQIIHFDEKSFPRNSNIADVVSFNFVVQKAATERAKELVRTAKSG